MNRQVKNILLKLKGVGQSKVAEELGVSRQVMSYRMRRIYPAAFTEFLTLLDIAGYEVKEK